MARYIVAVLGLLIVIGGLVGIKATQISGLIKAGEAFAKAGPPPETVSTDQARELSWEGKQAAVGTVGATRGVVVSNDAAGVVKRITFQSGTMAKDGQALVELDNGVERAQLATAKARLELAEQNVKRTRALFESGGVSHSQLDNDESSAKGAAAEVAGLEAQIERKIVRAAFPGRLGLSMINLGQYLSPGTMITTLEALDSVFVDFTLPQQALQSVQLGQTIHLTIRGSGGAGVDGKIAAIDPAVDPNTRAVRIRATVDNPGQKLRPGMFANLDVMMPKSASIVAIPSTSVVHAPYGDSVFLVESPKPSADDKSALPPEPGVKQVRQQFVRLGEERGDFVAVLDGVKPGDELVSAGAFKLRNGARVVVNNKVKPSPELNPRPENR
jgi:membrane fusion protein (multidrug efflux system)